MATLVEEEWYKGTPLDTTTFTEILHSNIHGDGKVEGLVASFMCRGLTRMVFFEILGCSMR